jgi:hypothetical protein
VLFFSIIVALFLGFPVVSAVPVPSPVPLGNEDNQSDEERLMTDAELGAWKRAYENVGSMLETVLEYYKTNEKGEERQVTVPKRNIACTIAHLCLHKDDVEKFKLLADEVYRWELRRDPIAVAKGEVRAFSELTSQDEESAVVKADNKVLVVPKGYKLYLQLYINKNWQDWVYIGVSERKGAHDFPSNTLIGCYCGKPVWVSEYEGHGEPTEDEFKKFKVEEQTYALTYRNAEGRMMTVVPDGLRDVESGKLDYTQLYMGMQYMNNPCWSLRTQTRAHEDARKKINVLFTEDGNVKSLKKIGPDAELLVAYAVHEQQHFTAGEVKKPAAKKVAAAAVAAAAVATCDDDEEEDKNDEDYINEEEVQKKSNKKRNYPC